MILGVPATEEWIVRMGELMGRAIICTLGGGWMVVLGMKAGVAEAEALVANAPLPSKSPA